MKSFITIALFLSAALIAWVTFRPIAPGSANSGTTMSGHVLDIIDGDSLKVRTGKDDIRVELAGIDAPEIGQAFGEISAYYLTDLLDGREVRLVVNGNNDYGDAVAEVFLDDLSINRLMLTDGYAWALRGRSEDPAMEGLESLARNKRLGLWRNDDPVSPWAFRELRD